MSSPLVLWTKFFRSCNLPNNVCDKYAITFVRERIQPAMLKDLSKSELRELGIETVGDQLAILKHIKESDGVPPELSDDTRSNGTPDIREIRRGRPPPDRNEIYHVTMPEGRHPRTRAILERHAELREAGRISRGTTGVRVGGVAINRVSNDSRVIKKPNTSSYENQPRRKIPTRNEKRLIAATSGVSTTSPTRPINTRGANRFAQAVGIKRDPIRVSGAVRVGRPAAYDEDLDDGYGYERRRGPVSVVRRVRYV